MIVETLKIEKGDSFATLDEFREKLRETALEIKKLADAGQDNQALKDQYDEMAETLSKLESGINKTADGTENLAERAKSVGSSFKNIGSSIKGVAQGGEDASKSMKKLSNETDKTKSSLKGIDRNSEGFQKLDELSGGLASRLFDVAEAAQKSGKAMKTALISSGIGLAVALVGLIAENWDKVSLALGNARLRAEKFREETERTITVLEEELATLETQEEILKLQGASTLEIRKEQEKKLLLIQAENEKLLESLETQLLMERSQVRQVTLWEKIKIQALGAAGAYQLQGEAIAESIIGNEEQRKLLADLELQIAKTSGKAADLELLLLKINQPTPEQKAAAKKKAEEIQKTLELEREARLEASRLELEEAQNLLLEIEKLEEDSRNRRIGNEEAEIQAVEDKYFRLLTLAEKFGVDMAALEELRLEELSEIREEYGEKRREQAEKINSVLTKANEDEEKREKELQDTKVGLVRQGFEAVGNLAEAFAGKSRSAQKKAFNIQKGAAVAKATIDTWVGAQAAFADTPGPLPLKIIAASIAVASGLANVKKILSTKFEGGSSSSGSGSSSVPSLGSGQSNDQPQASGIDFGFLGDGDTTTTSELNGEQPSTNVKAIVVAEDVTDQQEIDQQVEELSKV